MSYPNTRAPPRVGRRSVASTSMAVVLPAPFGPSSPTIAPAGPGRSDESCEPVSPKALPRPTASIAGGAVHDGDAIASPLGFELEIAVAVIERSGRLVDGLIDDCAVRRQRADRIRVRRAAGEGERLAATPAEVDGLSWTTPTWLRHPLVAAEGTERRRLFPDPSHRPIANGVELQRGDVGGTVAGKDSAVGRDD